MNLNFLKSAGNFHQLLGVAGGPPFRALLSQAFQPDGAQQILGRNNQVLAMIHEMAIPPANVTDYKTFF